MFGEYFGKMVSKLLFIYFVVKNIMVKFLFNILRGEFFEFIIEIFVNRLFLVFCGEYDCLYFYEVKLNVIDYIL